MKKIAVTIHSLARTILDSACILTLLTKDNTKAFLIVMSANEALAFNNVEMNCSSARPQTHDLMLDMLQRLDVEVQEVYIRDLKEGIFYATIYCMYDEQMLEFEAKPSDALILAIKTDAPIFVNEKIIQTVGFQAKDLNNILYSEQNDDEIEDDNYHHWNENVEDMSSVPQLKYATMAQLERLLSEAVAEENFELASEIRDIINEKKNNSDNDD